MDAVTPIDDAARRADALALLDILDTPAERAFDDIVFIAAQTCATPIAAVSLLDGHRQWFKARIGLEIAETSIDQAVCHVEIDRGELLVIPDLTIDPRTAANPLVTGAAALRFYAGAPLVAHDGVVIGRLCVIDLVARPAGLDDTQLNVLTALARQVGDQIELRRIARASSQALDLQAALLDIGDRIRRSDTIAAMTYATAEIVGRTLHVGRTGYGTVDAATETVDLEPGWTRDGVIDIAGRHRFADFGRIRDELAAGEPLVIDDVLTDPRTAADPAPMQALDIGALVNMPVRDRGQTVALLLVHAGAARRWTTAELTFLRAVADRLEAGVARLRSDQQQQTLNGEISHRLKNMLAMVQAIASQTLRGIAERAPIDLFEQRLVALGTAHDVLMQKSWIEADIASVVGASIAIMGCDDRVEITGEPLALGPRAVLSLSLVIHELMTNAAKYGALSVDAGRVALGWTTEQVDGTPTLVMRWRERGGPPVVPPARRGFGSKLIRLGLTGTGGVDLRYHETGLEADLRAPIDHLVQS